MAERSVTFIPTSRPRLASFHQAASSERRVAAYARVSTDNEEQMTSQVAQVEYYTQYIQEHADWVFVKVYADEGISATSTKHREGFKQMVQDALDGKIDLILTKSISRFARNTVDTLTTVRLLKEHGVEVFFEKENIFTFDSKGEVLITIMSSIAQEESRSISENVTWGRRKRMADGKVVMPYGRFLGYEKGEGDRPIIIEEEAAIVRLIYSLFLSGKTPHGIAKHLMVEGIPTPGGGNTWCMNTIRNILSNEKYKGDALLQKTFTVDFLTKKKKLNEGEVPQYFVQNSHPAIVSADVFDMVQEEIKRRQRGTARHSGTSIFSSKIICGECGSFYGAKVWHSNDPYRKVIWQCNGKFGKARHCKSPHITEESVKETFVEAFNQIIEDKEEIIAGYEMVIRQIMGNDDLEMKIRAVESDLADIIADVEKLVAENARTPLNQTEYDRRFKGLEKKLNGLESEKKNLQGQILSKNARLKQIEAALVEMRKQDGLISEFDEQLWLTMVEAVVVGKDGESAFRLRGGSEILIGRDLEDTENIHLAGKWQ
jgi:site-specific DNA recombinase